MKRLTWIGVDGVEWPLSGPGVRGVFVEHGGVGEIVGRRELSTTSLVGVPGAGVVDGQIPPIEFSLGLVFASATKYGPHGDVEDIWHSFMRGCALFEQGVLRLEDDQRESLELACVVKQVPVLPTVNRASGALRGEVGFIAPRGVWEMPRVSTDATVLVSNHGDVYVWPKLRWSGAGGQVELPSGARFVLPPTVDWRTFDLNPAHSGQVVDDRGVLDRDLWLQLRSTFLEGVPAGEQRQFLLPPGVELLWRIGVLNPWR